MGCLSKEDRSVARDTEGACWGLEEEAFLGRRDESGGAGSVWEGRRPINTSAPAALPLHLSQAHTGTSVCLSLPHCVSSSPRWEGVAWAQMPFMDGQYGEDSASRGKTTPGIHNSDLTLELPPSGQSWHPGILECREWLALFQGPRVAGVPSSQKKADIFGRLESPGEGSLQSS